MKKTPSKKKQDSIVIDAGQGLVFKDEEALYEHFESQIQQLEKEFFLKRRASDIQEHDFGVFEFCLPLVLEEPDEIWEDANLVASQDWVRTYIKFFDSVEGIDAQDPFYYVALCRMTGEIPSFVYLHFPTRDEDLLEDYRRGKLLYDKSSSEALPGALDGDALMEGDSLAEGLYKAMLLLRTEKDIPESEFQGFRQMREDTLEEPDEIWRSTDSQGFVLVTFIKDCTPEGEDPIYYLVITQEDVPSQSHALMFSFPTNDRSLVDRYRHGENLQADEVIQESSH